jgi:hypothetical protein
MSHVGPRHEQRIIASKLSTMMHVVFFALISRFFIPPLVASLMTTEWSRRHFWISDEIDCLTYREELVACI